MFPNAAQYQSITGPPPPAGYPGSLFGAAPPLPATPLSALVSPAAAATGTVSSGVPASVSPSGLVTLLPASAQNWFQYLAEVYDETFVSPASASGQLYLAYAALDQAIIGHAIENEPGEIDISTLSAVQRATAVECLRAIAERARTVMLRLVIYDAANEYILSTPLDQLDTSESGKRYTRIFEETLKAHPAAKYVFSGY